MRRLELSPRDVDLVVLSHGRFDHTTGLNGFIHAVGGSVGMPVVIHPECWTQRRIDFPARDPVELPSTSQSALVGPGSSSWSGPRDRDDEQNDEDEPRDTSGKARRLISRSSTTLGDISQRAMGACGG